MAKDIGAPPALLARNVLEKHCGKDESNGNIYIYKTWNTLWRKVIFLEL